MKNTKEPLIILAGPTAVGKSEAAIALAKKISGSIISADSMQVYRGMDIGSAKVTKAEMGDVPHYLIDVLDPAEEFHVVRFQGLAKKAIDEIRAMGRVPILCGGTGFYIQALLYDIDFTEEPADPGLREELSRLAKEEGSAALHAKLEALDPGAAAQIHPNNTKRLIRAIEFYERNGKPISAHNAAEHEKEAAFSNVFFCLTMNREKLYKRIEARVDRMLENGLLEEVRRLREAGCTTDMVSMQGLGYQELSLYLDGELSYEEAVYRIKRDSRHFAKRQLTWMKRERDVIWLSRDEYPDTEKLVEKMLEIINQKKIL